MVVGRRRPFSLMERTIAPNVSTWAASTRGEPEPPRVTNTFPLLLRSGEYPREENMEILLDENVASDQDTLALGIQTGDIIVMDPAGWQRKACHPENGS